LAIVNDALEDFDETLRENLQFDDGHFMHADLGGAHSGGLQEIRMALESKLDSCQLQTYLKGKANISYVDNKIQDLEKNIQNSRRVIFEDTHFTDLHCERYRNAILRVKLKDMMASLRFGVIFTSEALLSDIEDDGDQISCKQVAQLFGSGLCKRNRIGTWNLD
jgi:hypothetical protein